MSLDSAHLVYDLETYFQVQFQQADLERVKTIQEMADLAALTLGITNREAPLRARIGEQVQQALRSMGLSTVEVPGDDRIFLRLDPEDPMRWEEFCAGLGLVVPKPHLGREKPKRSLFAPIVDYIWRASYDPHRLTLDQLVTAICVANHKELIDPRRLSDAFEVYVGVVAVTITCLGLDVYEIEPHKSFANDLGVD